MHAVLKMETMVYYELEKYFLENSSLVWTARAEFCTGGALVHCERCGSVSALLDTSGPASLRTFPLVICCLKQVHHRGKSEKQAERHDFFMQEDEFRGGHRNSRKDNRQTQKLRWEGTGVPWQRGKCWSTRMSGQQASRGLVYGRKRETRGKKNDTK